MAHKKPNRVLRVIVVLIIVMILALLGLWLFEGGASSVARTVRALGNPVDIIFNSGTTTYSARLPWQPDTMPRGPDISPLIGVADQLNGGASGDEQTGKPEEAIMNAGGVRSFGSPSPYAGAVTIEDGDAATSDPHIEFVRLTAAERVTITGWSLQSAISGLRAYIPSGSSAYAMGTVNSPESISLEAGMTVVITTGQSPTGVSFRENKCTGYLGQMQEYNPPLMNSCPSPGEILPQTASNVKNFGQDCIDFAQTLPRCYFPTSVPSNLSSSCRAFIANNYTYGGCMNHYGNANPLPSWRIYLGQRAELWYNTHDTIRLLDAEGRVVDSFSY